MLRVMIDLTRMSWPLDLLESLSEMMPTSRKSPYFWNYYLCVFGGLLGPPTNTFVSVLCPLTVIHCLLLLLRFFSLVFIRF